MVTADPRHDAYIAKARPFAQPILEHLRKLVRAACPEVVETIKWGMPFFVHVDTLCYLAAFKAHCAFGFWKAKLVLGEASTTDREAMGHFGRITTLAELPSDAELKRLVTIAMRLNEQGAPGPRAKPSRKSARAVAEPPELKRALAANAKARAGFAKLTPGRRREYVVWIAEAKRPETRARRIADAMTWVAQGKSLNWKYQR